MNEYLGLTPEDAELIERGLAIMHAAARIAWDWKDADFEQWKAIRARLQDHAKLVIPDMGRDKVWTGLTMDLVASHRQTRTIVRARSRVAAANMLQAAGERISVTHMSKYWTETGNREELCAATEPGIWVWEPILTAWRRI